MSGTIRSTSETISQCRELVSRMSAILVISLGAFAVWDVTLELASHWLSSRGDEGRATPKALNVTTTGQVLLATPMTPRAKAAYQSLDGQELQIQSKTEFLDSAELPPTASPSPESRDSDASKEVVLAVNAGDPAIYWYFVYDAESIGAGAFQGYDATTNDFVGYIGKQGLQAPQLDSEDKFSVSADRLGFRKGATADFTEYAGHMPIYKRQILEPRGSVYLVSEGVLYDINLLEGTVKPVTFGERIVSIDIGSVRGGVGVPGDGRPATRIRGISWRLFVRTSSQVIVYNPRTSDDYRIPIPKRFTNKPIAVFAISPDRTVFVTAETNGTRCISDVDAQGNVLSLGSLPHIEASRSPFHFVEAARVPSPLAAVRNTVVLLADLQHRSRFENLSQAMRAHLVPLIEASVPSAICLLLLFRSHRFRTQDNVWLWSTFIFLVGPFCAAAYWVEYEYGRTDAATISRKPELLGTEILI